MVAVIPSFLEELYSKVILTTVGGNISTALNYVRRAEEQLAFPVHNRPKTTIRFVLDSMWQLQAVSCYYPQQLRSFCARAAVLRVGGKGGLRKACSWREGGGCERRYDFCSAAWELVPKGKQQEKFWSCLRDEKVQCSFPSSVSISHALTFRRAEAALCSRSNHEGLNKIFCSSTTFKTPSSILYCFNFLTFKHKESRHTN